MTNFYESKHTFMSPYLAARRGDAGCVASLEEYSIRQQAGWTRCSKPARHKTHFSTEHHTEESPGGEEEEKQDISM